MEREERHVARGIVLALLGAICWGFSANCSEVLMDVYDVPVGWISCVRTGWSALVFLALAAVFRRHEFAMLAHDARSIIRIAAFGVLGVFFTQITYLSAIKLAGSGPALLLEQIGLAIIMLYVCLRSRRLPTKIEVAGLLCALLGVFFIATQGDPSALSIPADGLVWGLLSALALAFYNLFPEVPLVRYSAFTVVGFGMLASSAVSFTVYHPWEMGVELPFEGLLICMMVVLVGSILAFLLYLQGLKYAGPVRAGLLGSIEPVSGMVIGALWLGSTVTAFDVLGAMAIVGMIALVTLGRPHARGNDAAEVVETRPASR